MPSLRHTPCGRRLDAKLNEFDAKNLILPLPGLSTSTSTTPATTTSVQSSVSGSDDGLIAHSATSSSPDLLLTGSDSDTLADALSIASADADDTDVEVSLASVGVGMGMTVGVSVGGSSLRTGGRPALGLSARTGAASVGSLRGHDSADEAAAEHKALRRVVSSPDANDESEVLHLLIA